MTKNTEIKTGIGPVEKNIVIDFSFDTVWVSENVGQFSNFLKDEEMFFKKHYELFSEIVFEASQIPRKNLKSKFGNHAHKLSGEQIEVSKKVLKKLIRKVHSDFTVKQTEDFVTQNVGDEELHQIGRQGLRLIGYYKDNVFYVLFIDYHHLVSPDSLHNAEDVAVYELCPYARGC